MKFQEKLGSRHWFADNAMSLGVLAVFLTAFLAIDDRSLWVDEFYTWILTQHDNFAQWWDGFQRHRESDNQQPLYHFSMYFWCSLFGTSELALRSANVLFFAIAVWGILQAPLRFRLRALWIAFFSLNAFTWFYLNEARPYLMFVAGASLMCTGWLHVAVARNGATGSSTRKGLALFSGGCVLLAGANILGLLWVASAGLTILFLYKGRMTTLLRATSEIWWWVLGCLLAGTVIVLVASSSFIGGVRVAPMGFSLQAMGYGVIELLGMAGLGPGRNDLRAGLESTGYLVLVPMILASLVAGIAVLLASRRAPAGYLGPACFALLAPLLCVVLIGELLDMRFLGRHLAVLLIPVTLAYATAFETFEFRLSLRSALLAALATSLLMSTLMIKYARRHHKDDYASAIQSASKRLRRGETVWWVAENAGAAYYGLIPISGIIKRSALGKKSEVSIGTERPNLLISFSRRSSVSEDLGAPNSIFLSKRYFDKAGFVARFVQENDYRKIDEMPGFTVFAP